MKSEKLTMKEKAIILGWWLLIIIWGTYVLMCITGEIEKHSVGLMFGGTIVVLIFPAIATIFTQKN